MQDSRTLSYSRQPMIKYKEQEILSASPERLVLHLYDYIIRCCSTANCRDAARAVAELIDGLDFTYNEIADNLNRRGFKPSKGQKFTSRIISMLRRNHNLKSRYDRLRKKGLLTADEMAKELKVSASTVKIWCRYGLLRGYKYNDKGGRLFKLGAKETRPVKSPGPKFKLSERPKDEELVSHATNGVQFE